MSNVGSAKLLDAATATGVSAAAQLSSGERSQRTFHAYGTTSAGAGAATVIVEVSDDAAPSTAATAPSWITAGTITLVLGTTRTDDGFAVDATWRWVRARMSAINGTNAAVTVQMGG